MLMRFLRADLVWTYNTMKKGSCSPGSPLRACPVSVIESPLGMMLLVYAILLVLMSRVTSRLSFSPLFTLYFLYRARLLGKIHGCGLYDGHVCFRLSPSP